MRDFIRRFFGSPAEKRTQTDRADTEHDLNLATCALFVEMAKIDETFSPAEMQVIVSILKEKYGLSAEHADEMMALAEEELKGSVDYWQFARLINENYSTQEKIDIIETLWRIVFVDGKMDKYEHHLMHKLSTLLRLTTDQLIDAKMRVLYPESESGA
jgi:uncharacterized tellurite resistance protein B-like protein